MNAHTVSLWATPRRAALVIAHPGHELRVHRWLELAKPTVFVLTDGSGAGHRSRLGSTSRVLAGAGATAGSLYGCFTDADLYAAILRGDTARLLVVARELVRALSGVDYVVGDALEGFNPSHDVCRFLINLAISRLHEEEGRAPANFDFLLHGSPEFRGHVQRESTIRVDLDASSFERKLSVARGYCELKSETESALERFGSQAFLAEYLRPVVDLHEGLGEMGPEPPFYETHGEQQVRAGHYREVIRYRSNMQPLVTALWREAGLEADSARRLTRQSPHRPDDRADPATSPIPARESIASDSDLVRPAQRPSTRT